MKRMLNIITVLFVATAVILTWNTSANAKSKPTPAGPTSQVTNVSISYYVDYYTGMPMVNAMIFDPTPDNPYNWSPCSPEICGTILITSSKKATAFLSLVPNEQLGYGGYGYSNTSNTQYSGGYWDGSALPMTKKVKSLRSKPVLMHLSSAFVGLYLPGHPVPDYSVCCK